MRVFADRFLQDSADDMGRFIDILGTKMRDNFEDAEWSSVMGDVDDERYGPIICSFMDEGAETLSYEEVSDFAQLKQRCEDKLEDYNLEPKLINMNLVLFKDAVRHVCRIHRTPGAFFGKDGSFLKQATSKRGQSGCRTLRAEICPLDCT